MRTRSWWRFLRVLAGLTLAASIIPPQVAFAFDCSAVHVVWACGAMLQPNGIDFQGFYTNALETRIQEPVTQSVFQLGNTGYNGYLYAPVQNWRALLGAGFHGIGDVDADYRSSVQSGRDELVHYLTDRAAGCSNEVYVLGGFSEGAQVVGEGLSDLPQNVRDRVAARGVEPPAPT
jgi:hypothetical protein